MQKRRTYSFPLAFVAASAVTFVLFLLMYQLIHRDTSRSEFLEAVEIVDITPPPEQQEQQPEENNEPDTPPEEPTLPELAVSTPVPAPTLQVDLPPVAMNVSEFKIRTPGNWSPPAATGIGTGELDAGGGKGNGGFRILEPRGSRQPNIPQIAWDNKIDGWVLVSFVVYNNGTVGKVQVMDSHPRGIFEEEVVSAVSSWIYDAFKGPPIQLTQKVELFWKNYPNNIRQLY